MFDKTKKILVMMLIFVVLAVSVCGVFTFADEEITLEDTLCNEENSTLSEEVEESSEIALPSEDEEDNSDICIDDEILNDNLVQDETLPTEEELALAKAALIEDAEISLMNTDDFRIYNEYIETAIAYNGRFTMGTLMGNPANMNDDNKKMLYGHPYPGTSETTIRIDGSDVRYSVADLSQMTTNDSKTKHTSYMEVLPGVMATQELTIVKNLTTGLYDTVEIKYIIKNNDTENHKVGVRIMLDTMLWNNDHAPFKIPGYGELTTRKEFVGDDIPQYWQVFDSLENPSVIASGTLIKSTSNKPDRVQFTNWGSVYDSAWNCELLEGSSNGDSAVCVIWDEADIAPGAVKTCVTYYGLSTFESSQLTNYLVNISAPKTLDLNTGKDNYEPNPFTIVAYVQNVTDETRTNIKAKINLPAELILFDASSAEVNIGSLSPGEHKLASWVVFAAGQTAEKEVTYAIDVSDPEGTENTSSTILLPQVFESDKTISDLGFYRTMGYMYEQRADVALNTRKPDIKKVTVTTLDKNKGKYKFEIKNGDFVCDSSGVPFFYWESENGHFVSADNDYKTVEFMVDAGTGGQKVQATVHIGDGLGYVAEYTVEVEGKNYSSGDGEFTCEFADEIYDVKGWSTMNIRFDAYLTEDMQVMSGTVLSIYYYDAGEWKPVVRDIVDRQSYQWIVPNVKISNTKLKLVAVNGTKSKTVISNEFDITPTCYVQGNVLTMEGTPVVGERVFVGSQNAITDFAGYYIIKDLTPGTYSVSVDGTDYVQSVQSFTVSTVIPKANKIFRKR